MQTKPTLYLNLKSIYRIALFLLFFLKGGVVIVYADDGVKHEVESLNKVVIVGLEKETTILSNTISNLNHRANLTDQSEELNEKTIIKVLPETYLYGSANIIGVKIIFVDKTVAESPKQEKLVVIDESEIVHTDKESLLFTTKNVPTSFIYSIYNNIVSTFPVQIGSFNCFKQYYTIKHLEKKNQLFIAKVRHPINSFNTKFRVRPPPFYNVYMTCIDYFFEILVSS